MSLRIVVFLLRNDLHFAELIVRMYVSHIVNGKLSFLCLQIIMHPEAHIFLYSSHVTKDSHLPAEE